MDLAVVGLGKLGSPLAALLAASGNTVTGVDRHGPFVEAVESGIAPVPEQGLQDLMDVAAGRLHGTTDVAAAVRASEAVFVVVPTPSGPDHRFSLTSILIACDEIGPHLGADGRHRVVVITSTVNPGDTESAITPALEAASGLVAGRDFSVAYNPEFIALGSVIADMREPDFILIGTRHPRASEVLHRVYRSIHGDPLPPVAEMTPVNAEIAKLAVNTFVTTRVSYANMLASICERALGGDIDDVTAALGLDSRIGPKYLRGGMPFGGPCFPRDNAALEAFAASVGVDAPLAAATNHVNATTLDRIVGTVRTATAPGATVAVMGLSYKPGTPVVEEAPGIAIANRLATEGFAVVAHDPQALPGAADRLDPAVTADPDAGAALETAETVVIATPWDSVVTAVRELLDRPGGPRRTVVDGWRVLRGDGYVIPEPHAYVAPGIGATRP